jgi:hypothetical protein
MDKFKKDLQHKFNHREIQPTDEAWGNITGELATSRNHKTKSLWFWGGIAAGFVGLLVLLSPLYVPTTTNVPVANSEEKETQTIQVKRESMVSVNQLQSRGIKVAPIQISKSKSVINFTQPFTTKNLTPTHLNPKTLLAEVEQEIEMESFSQNKIEEVDALLAQARAKLESDQDRRILDLLTTESLLAEIDSDNAEPFKTKVWKLIEMNYKELKSSLTAR